MKNANQSLRRLSRQPVAQVGLGDDLAVELVFHRQQGTVGGVGEAAAMEQHFDPLACGAVALLLAIVTLFACWLAARRAAKCDPVVALSAG